MPIAQHAVVEQRRRMIQDNHVDRVRCELLHEERSELGSVTVATRGKRALINIDGHIDVAVWLGKPACMRPKQVGFPYLGMGSERGGKGAHERVG